MLASVRKLANQIVACFFSRGTPAAIALAGALVSLAAARGVRADEATEPREPAAAAPSAAAPSPAPAPAKGTSAPAKAKPETAVFHAPFPQREELFQPPNHKGLTKAQRDEVHTEVILKGFVNVDGTKALLSINGKVASMSAGETQFGVELVSIAPPQVTLQRGRVRWTESLYAGK